MIMNAKIIPFFLKKKIVLRKSINYSKAIISIFNNQK